MTATQAPTPGPLSGNDEMLYARAIVFATRDKPSNSYLQRRLQIDFNLAASLIERMENEGLISKANSAGKRTILVPFSAPTAPVEASGSERRYDSIRDAEDRELFSPALRPQPSGETREVAGTAEPQVGRAVYERIEKLLTTNPQGWERDYLCHLVESVEEVGGYDGPRLDRRDDRQAVADFLKLRDESVGHSEVDDAERLESADEILALLSARPLALRGQQGEDRGVELTFGMGALVVNTGTFGGDNAVFIAKATAPGKVGAYTGNAAFKRDALQPGEHVLIFPTSAQAKSVADALCTPARAEAQDEGGAGEPVAIGTPVLADFAEAEVGTQTLYVAGVTMGEPGMVEPEYWLSEKWPVKCRGDVSTGWKRDNFTSVHPSPTPAADADRVRIALTDLVSWFDKPVQGERGMVWVIRAGDQGADDAIAEALAALKSEGK